MAYLYTKRKERIIMKFKIMTVKEYEAWSKEQDALEKKKGKK